MLLSQLRRTTAVLLVVVMAVGLAAGGVVFWAQAQPALPGQHGVATSQEKRKPEEATPAKKREGAIFRVPGSFTVDVALTADGKLLARGGADGTVDLWDVASGQKLHVLKGHTAPILRVAFSPDGKTLASITGTWLPDDVRGEVKLWDVATGKERVELKGHPNRMLSLAFSPDGKTLATSSETVKLWDVETGKEKLELRVSARPRQLVAWSLAFAPDGKTLATGTGGGPMDVTPSSVILWEVTTGKERATFSGHPNSITWVGFAPDGKTLASASGPGAFEEGKPLPGELKLWDVATAKERATIAIRSASILQFFDLVFAADGKTLISAMASLGQKNNEIGYAVQYWEVPSGKEWASFWAPYNFGGPGVVPYASGTNAGIFFTALSANGKTVAWGGAEEQDKKITGTAHVWEVQSLPTSPPKKPEAEKEALTAEELFRKFEKAVQEGKSLFVAYVGERTTKKGQETTRSHYGGTYYVRPGNSLVMQPFDSRNAYVRYWAIAPTANYFGPVTRQGFFHDNLTSRLFVDLFLPRATDFRFVKPKADTDAAGSKIIAYTLYLDPVEKAPASATQVTLWLDEKSLAPLKRFVRWSSEGKEFEVTERYQGFSTGEIPAPFQGTFVPVFVLGGKLTAKIGPNWLASSWLLENTLYRAEEETSLLFGEGAKFTLAPAAEFITVKSFPGFDLRLTKGRLAAELGPADTVRLVLGPARLGSGLRPNRGAVITATPERIVVEKGIVEFKGVTAEPSSEVQTFALSGHLLHEGVEYRLADGKLQGQKERTLPGPNRPK